MKVSFAVLAGSFLAAGLLVPLASPRSKAPAREDTLRLSFGVYQSDKATVMYRQFIPVLDALTDRIGVVDGCKVDIEIRIHKTYDDAIEALATGEVDFVRFGPASYILAKQRNEGVKLLAMEEEKGQKRFKGIIVANARSPVQSLGDLRGRTFAFGDPNSTIGRYLVQAVLADAGIHASDLKSFKYLDRHDKVAKAVEIGDFDAGSIKSETFKTLPAGAVRVLAEFDNVTKPWVARAGLDDAVFKALQDALLTLDDKVALKELGVSGFSRTSDAEYQMVREGMAKAEAFGK